MSQQAQVPSSASTDAQKKPEKRERKRGLRKGLYVLRCIIGGRRPLREMIDFAMTRIFGKDHVSICVDKQTVVDLGDNSYECVVIVDRAGVHSEVSEKFLDGRAPECEWHCKIADDIENWKAYFQIVSEQAYLQSGKAVDRFARINTVINEAISKRSISECKKFCRENLSCLEWSTYRQRICELWMEEYKQMRAEEEVTDLYPVKNDSGCICAIKDWIDEVFRTGPLRPRTLIIIGESRKGKSMTISNFLASRKWVEYQASDMSAKDKFGEQNLFRILDDTTFGIHTVDTLKMYLNSVDSCVNVKYGETTVVPIPTIMLLNRKSFAHIINTFSDNEWLHANVVLYPRQTEDIWGQKYVSEESIMQIHDDIYDTSKSRIPRVTWEDTMFYQVTGMNEIEFNRVYNSMKKGKDIWKCVRDKLRQVN